MLFALDWIQRTWNAAAAAVHAFTSALSLPAVSGAMTGFWPVLVACLLAGAVMCFYGFRYHKLIIGLVGAILMGVLGWYIGMWINRDQVAVAAIYAVLLALAGFFILYLCYFFGILAGSYFLFTAVLVSCQGVFQRYSGLVAFLLAVLYCGFYIKYKLAMTALTGAVILSLLVFSLSPAAAGALLCVFTAGGIYVQILLRRRYERLRIRLRQEELEKYPYGPGLAYGWPDPTLSHGAEQEKPKKKRALPAFLSRKPFAFLKKRS